MQQTNNAEKLQSVISDDLFPQVQHISDVKQVLEEMQSKAQNLREPQIKAILLLKQMGENKYLHGDKNPYKKLIEFIMEGKIHVADPEYYLETIEALIPKPPKPIVLAEKAERGKK
jgi:ABC-type hemin transport system substrate-binding protein